MTHLTGAVALRATQQDREEAAFNGGLICEYQRSRKTGENPAHAGRNYKETGISFEAKSQLAEIKVAEFLGCREAYIGFTPDKDEYKRPDIMDVAEVRRVLEPCNFLPVYDKDTKADALMVKTYYADNTIYIIGWDTAKRIEQNGMPIPHGMGGVVLKSPQTLSEAFWGRVAA